MVKTLVYRTAPSLAEVLAEPAESILSSAEQGNFTAMRSDEVLVV